MSPIRRLFPLLTLALISLWAGGLSSVAAQDSHPIVVLDPGHGWVNESGTIVSGAVSGDLVEKDINLDVAQHARTFLSRCPVEVELTREGDDHEHTLDDLAGLVNSAHPTIGISIHTNSGTGSPSGTEGW
jgi:N-acetylmuramoyl-L-alanine amidase